MHFDRVCRAIQRLHGDQTGVISLLSVFVMLGCTSLLLWVFNSAKQLDSKVRMQNAVDATGQSGAGILARGMNAIAFANHLEADLLAAVIVMRAAESTPASGSPLVQTLQPAFELILAGEVGQPPVQRPISAFRMDIVRETPWLANEAVKTIGLANGRWRGGGANENPDGPQGVLTVQLWSGQGFPVGYVAEDNPWTRTLPVIDPGPMGFDASTLPGGADGDALLNQARSQRERWVRHYMSIWAHDVALGDDQLAQLILTRAEVQLVAILNELYRDTNLPLMLRSSTTSRTDLERDFMFVAVASRRHPPLTASRMFHNPLSQLAPAMTVAQVHLFLPRARYVCCPWGEWHLDERTGLEFFVSQTDGWPGDWTASTQNWQAKLVPVTIPAVSQILSSSAPDPSWGSSNWGRLTPRQLDELFHH